MSDGLCPCPAPATDGGQGWILVVEDEPMLRELTATVLGALGYQVRTAGDGREGAELFRLHHASLKAVLLDLLMPVMGGRESFLAMHSHDPGVPVIICSGCGESAEVAELLGLGAAGILGKPFLITELAVALARLTGH